MSMPINNPGGLLSAAAASFNKGQEISAANSKEKAEKANTMRMMMLRSQAVEKQKKANDPEGGFLA